MTLNLDSKADIKGETIVGLMFNKNGHHQGSPLRSYSNMGSPTLPSFWTMMVT